MTEDLPENLRKIRVTHNYSQEYVADEIGVSVSSYARYEGGKVAIDFDSVAKLASLYKMSIDEIYHYGDPSFNVNEPRESYLKKQKISVIVELDGVEDHLNQWIVKLQKLNAAI